VPHARRSAPKWGRYLAAVLGTSAATFLAALGAAWYLTGQLVAVTHVQDTYPLRVVAVTAEGTVQLTRGADATEPGTFRLAWARGDAVVGDIVSTTTKTVTRRLTSVHGTLAAGTLVGIEPDRYTGDPRTALGLPFSTVAVPTPLGGMPAWYLPGLRATWVVLVHGLGGSRSDTLPAMVPLHALGYPMLAITYRNDLGAPPSPQRTNRLGATEWHDVQAAVTYARAHGAAAVVLYGYSLGGAMTLIAASAGPPADNVRAIVLDSPVLDWQATLNYSARHHGIPSPFADLVEKLLARRIHLDYRQFDQLAQEPNLRTPVLVIQGTADTVVPPHLAATFSQRRPDLVTYLPVPGADHVSAIDTDPAAYTASVDTFLAIYP
jgi:hypothetical protein